MPALFYSTREEILMQVRETLRQREQRGAVDSKEEAAARGG